MLGTLSRHGRLSAEHGSVKPLYGSQPSARDLIERAKDSAERDVGGDDDVGCAWTVVEGQETGRLELAVGGWSALLAGHVGVQAGQNGHQGGKHEHGVDDSDGCTQPPG